MINSTKLLGIILTDNLIWDMNTANIVKKANARMQLLRKVATFGTSQVELKDSSKASWNNLPQFGIAH